MAVKKQFSSFEDLLSGSDVPVLVDFYATWCGPCQMMAPILDQVNAQLKGRLQVVKIDSDKYPQLASQYQIHALPTLVLFKNGQPVDRIEGVLPAEQILLRLQALV
jgi:thioredoxin